MWTSWREKSKSKCLSLAEIPPSLWPCWSKDHLYGPERPCSMYWGSQRVWKLLSPGSFPEPPGQSFSAGLSPPATSKWAWTHRTFSVSQGFYTTTQLHNYTTAVGSSGAICSFWYQMLINFWYGYMFIYTSIYLCLYRLPLFKHTHPYRDIEYLSNFFLSFLPFQKYHWPKILP